MRRPTSRHSATPSTSPHAWAGWPGPGSCSSARLPGSAPDWRPHPRCARSRSRGAPAPWPWCRRAPWCRLRRRASSTDGTFILGTVDAGGRGRRSGGRDVTEGTESVVARVMSEVERGLGVSLSALDEDTAASPVLRAVVEEFHRKFVKTRGAILGADERLSREGLIE